VLIVDDEFLDPPHLQHQLRRERLAVHRGRGRRDALEQVKRERPDVILLDVMMPRADGWTVRRAPRRTTRATGDIPIVFLTARAERRDRERAQSSARSAI
jgi:CheY-like chemotaxis protein